MKSVLAGSFKTHHETVQELFAEGQRRAHPVAEQVPISEPREPAGNNQAVAD